jgi:hypothetical protein
VASLAAGGAGGSREEEVTLIARFKTLFFSFCDESCSPFSFGWQFFRAQAEAKRAERETLIKKMSPDQRAAFLAQEDEVGDPSSRLKLLHVCSICASHAVTHSAVWQLCLHLSLAR